ncbi:MAG TPA: indolepyruvate ferredoxin oxidoreductase family protein, partial [Burkholderiaceae bacterium]|nr:indolepyruvate ferredoxin oxidoreductase family protein [Burkholderiaceae bacterium]
MTAPAPLSASDALQRALATVTLDDKYTLERGRAFMSGTQALVRLPMLQRERDRRAGLNTAGFISGYRGSPLGGFDQALWKARPHLARHDIVFQPGLNEDLAATSVWGSQQVSLSAKAKVDGVFGLWYGKGPGVDRCGDVFKHANAAGSSRHGGVIVLAGDDHGAKSSTLPHQSDHVFKACGLPVFYPATVQEYLDLGLHGWAMSRWSGLWVAMKTVTEVVEACASVEIDPDRVPIVLPDDFAMPPDGLNIRWPDAPLAQEARLLDYKWYAALAYVRANRLNRTVIDAPRPWFGIVTGGKAYLDTCQALEDLGLDAAACARIGLKLFKCAVVWPLEASSVREFATGLEEILVVEEKRQMLEYALKEELYNWRDDVRPRVYGKFDEKDGRGGEWSMPQGRWLLPAHAELSPALIARAIGARLLEPGRFGSRFELPPEVRAGIELRLAILEAKERSLAAPHVVVERTPTFCSGCPHNTSTHVPEGSRALAGIGCHYMTTWMPERRTATFTQMGGEGVPWIGQAPFTSETHVFANLGDGTYFHSGLLAIRASIAAGVNITYKILYNDAVAMTGGQPIDGTLTVPQIVAQLRAEGARRIVIASDEPERYDAIRRQPELKGVDVFHRDHLDWLQRELRETPGCTVLIYDQTCASEKRRRRKKVVDGKPGFPDPARRVVINEAVCEGCGDCSVQSSCVSVEPVETELGRKRRINQSSCNKDYSCLKGFCPSFVTIEGGRLRRPAAAGEAAAGELAPLPEPAMVSIRESGNRTYGILITGVGGTGVVTIGQLLGMAAHLEGKAVSVLDMAGLAQKGGAVFSHVQIADDPAQLHATRIATGEADLLLGCDLVVSAGNEALSKMRPGVTRAVVNDEVLPTSEFLRNPDWQLPGHALRRNILEAAGERDILFIGAQSVALALMGDALYGNPLLLGYAWQKGWVPLGRAALRRAIELNGISVEANLRAFEWGRRYAHDPATVRREAGIAAPADAAVGMATIQVHRRRTGTPGSTHAGALALQTRLDDRAARLRAYQNDRWAQHYLDFIGQVRSVEESVAPGASLRLSDAVARGLFKLMAYKDEYEVARLLSDPAFKAGIERQFEGDWSLRFHLAPPLLARLDPRTGRPRKIEFGPWLAPLLAVLARLKFLRGTPFDPFGWTAERRTERALIVRYRALIETVLAGLTPERLDLALEIARLPDDVRGYGPVKERHLKDFERHEAALMARWAARDRACDASDASGASEPPARVPEQAPARA